MVEKVEVKVLPAQRVSGSTTRRLDLKSIVQVRVYPPARKAVAVMPTTCAMRVPALGCSWKKRLLRRLSAMIARVYRVWSPDTYDYKKESQVRKTRCVSSRLEHIA